MAQFNPEDLNLNTGQAKKDLGPTPLDNSGRPETEISHAPLNLGGGGSAPTAAPKAAQAPRPAQAPAAPKPVQGSGPTVAPKPVAVAVGPQQPAAAGGRITKVKIFFTKLHAGALDFMTEQIVAWLAANPDIVIKRTNMVVGEIAAKMTEANLIISIWY